VGIPSLLHDFVDGKIEHSWHGADFLAHPLSGANEKGIDERLGGEARFSDQRTHSLTLAETPQACDRESHRMILSGGHRPLLF
jgi:hypothetical protein